MENHTLRSKSNLNYLVQKFTLLLSVFCIQADASPVASFNASQVTGCTPLNVHFTNTSTGATSYYWDLGNGNTSTLQDPDNLYATPGTYSITLIAIDGAGNRDTARYTNYITILANPSAGFYSSGQAACMGNNQFYFTNTSLNATSYQWDFGDGTVSSSVNPSHTYLAAGTYTITLIATNIYGCQDVKISNQFITIYPNPDATIQVSATASCDPSTVFQFSNNSSGTVAWLWNFGDNTSSALQNPSHVYSNPGIYPVTLTTTSNQGCTATSPTTTQIQVGMAYWVEFHCAADSGCAPFVANFGNTIPSNSTLFWDFGDGSYSNQGFPTHMYMNPGDYTVSLVITTALCSDTIIKTNFIHVGQKPTASFSCSNAVGCSPLPVQFTNTSTNFVSCQWFFGDGTTSTAVNPMHIYTSSGTYDVTLKCFGTVGCNRSFVQTNLVSVTSTTAIFTATPRIGCPPLPVNFTALAQGTGLTFHWDFGDGSVSSLQNPSHTYTTAGQFDVTLVIQDSLGCTDTIHKPAYIQTLNPAANYIPPPTSVGCAPLTTQFTDATVGASAWSWDFGDGTSSSIQNPVHTYTTPGFYTVSLTTSSAGGGCAQTINPFGTFDVRGGYAGFSHVDAPCPPYVSTFTDTSSNAVSWLWDFGDGTTSTLQHPTHTFINPGYHSVSLTITTVDGCSYTTMQSNSVYFSPFGARFFGIAQGLTYPLGVQFYANSAGATSWYWDFGDSSYSTQQNPFHTYQYAGNPNVTLTITNGLCTLFYDPPSIYFGSPDTTSFPTGNPGYPEIQRGCLPLNVTFTNHVLGSAVWHWDFGDGDTSDLEFPSHIYTRPGIYSITLSTIDTLGIPQVLYMDSMVHVGGPEAGFLIHQFSNCISTQINCIDTSRNAAQWSWSFGDGGIDSVQNPIHVYNSGMPNYIVTQTVTDTSGCSNSISTSLYASFVSPLLSSETEICGHDTVYFYTSIQNFQSYHWDFGDGTSSSLPAATHLYLQEGTYTVVLTITDNTGCVQTFTMNPPITVSLPSANFSTPFARHACDRLTTQFTNLSVNADYYDWNFGDGNTSSLYNPFHTYEEAGVYDVTLTIYRGNCASIASAPQYIRVDTAHAEFTRTLSSSCMPVTATFTDLSVNPVSWRWNFGNGDTSNVQNPVYTYNIRPCCWPRLIMTDINGCIDTAELGYFDALYADFIPTRDTGCLPMTVTFTDLSGNANNWYWDFGDGTTSTDQSPVHTYMHAGVYDVTLVVSGLNSGCTDTRNMTSLIHVMQPHAGFVSPDLAECAPFLVSFNDFSADADTYIWDFGDSSTSTNANPSHIYNRPGFYTVSQIVTNNAGCTDTLVRPQYIMVLGPTTEFSISAFEGCAPFHVDFTDQSVNAVQWSWNFGDGYADSLQNPFHDFQDSGSFTVSLVTSDTAGCSSYQEADRRIIVHPSPVALFTVGYISGCEPYQVSFNNQSTGGNTFTWNFDDGEISTDLNPDHLFQIAGNYDVLLVVENNSGCSDHFALNQPIEVLASPVPSFTASEEEGCSPFTVSFFNSTTNVNGPAFTWNFGDGTSSPDPTPVHIYNSPGIYNVSLLVANSNGCTDSIEYPGLIHVRDSVPPNESKILSVSVTSNTTVVITWENNAAIDLASYVLYRMHPGTYNFDPIFSENNFQNTGFSLNPTYTDTGLNTLSNTYTYKVQVFDLCGNAIPLNQLTAHTTINVSSRLQGTGIRVSWTPYGGCPVSSYEIFRSAHGEIPQYMTRVSADSLAYTDTTFQCPYPYSYRIRATDLCGNVYDSYSDTSLTMPLNIYADQVVDVIRSTVVDNHWILTEWKQPVVHPEKVVQFDLYRSTDNTNFSFLASVPPVQTDFQDYNVDVNQNHYYYKVNVINNCDITEELSQNTSSILLKGEMDEGRQVHLQWSPYQGWDTGVDHYILEKKDDNGHWQFLKQVDGDVNIYDYQE